MSTIISDKSLIYFLNLNTLFTILKASKPLGIKISQHIITPPLHWRLFRITFWFLKPYVLQSSGPSSVNLFSSLKIVSQIYDYWWSIQWRLLVFRSCNVHSELSESWLFYIYIHFSTNVLVPSKLPHSNLNLVLILSSRLFDPCLNIA